MDGEDGGRPGGGAGAPDGRPSDIDVLLSKSSCERFILRCVENELPPNLIHCLRLLRVLELQHDHAAALAAGQREGDGNGDHPEGAEPGRAGAVSARASSRVSCLLVLLCGDPAVGDQLRPHLVGLLALPGASYPPCGVHMALAASNVVRAFGAGCLSPSLVWFLHDR